MTFPQRRLARALLYLGYSSAQANVSSRSYTFLGAWAKNPSVRLQ